MSFVIKGPSKAICAVTQSSPDAAATSGRHQAGGGDGLGLSEGAHPRETAREHGRYIRGADDRAHQANAGVEWYYRNGDKGDEYFSIVYADNAGRDRLFYPDYILRLGGKTWIIEIKGGWNGSGQSQNIDQFAEKKAAALNAYCAKHKLCGGFVAHDDGEDILLISERGYSEDLKAACWKPIADI